MTKAIYRQEHQALIKALRGLRNQAGLTQIQCAQALGRPQSFVSAYETGIRRLDLVQLQDLCTALGTTLTELVRTYEDELARLKHEEIGAEQAILPPTLLIFQNLQGSLQSATDSAQHWIQINRLYGRSSYELLVLRSTCRSAKTRIEDAFHECMS